MKQIILVLDSLTNFDKFLSTKNKEKIPIGNKYMQLYLSGGTTKDIMPKVRISKNEKNQYVLSSIYPMSEDMKIQEFNGSGKVFKIKSFISKQNQIRGYVYDGVAYLEECEANIVKYNKIYRTYEEFLIKHFGFYEDKDGTIYDIKNKSGLFYDYNLYSGSYAPTISNRKVTSGIVCDCDWSNSFTHLDVVDSSCAYVVDVDIKIILREYSEKLFFLIEAE